MLRLGVNIDHVATLRQTRGTVYPDPIQAALIAQHAGADSITVHLREDRRHIQLEDVVELKRVLNIPLNLEMALSDEMIQIAIDIAPAYCCLVPERREELTTEGGLNVFDQQSKIQTFNEQLQSINCALSLFIDPDFDQIQASQQTGTRTIELHTGTFSDAESKEEQSVELKRLVKATEYAQGLGLIVNAGHGLNACNLKTMLRVDALAQGLHELNIGHSIIAEAIFDGLHSTIKRIKKLLS